MSEFSPVIDWNTITATEVVGRAHLSQERDALYIPTADSELVISLSGYLLRLSTCQQRTLGYDLLTAEPACDQITLVESADSVAISNGVLTVKIGFHPFYFEVSDQSGARLMSSANDGHFIRRHRVPPLAKTDFGWFFSIALASNEAVYGLGEKWGTLNKRGQWLRSYNADALGVNAEISYKNTPFLWSPEGWGIFIHTPSPVGHGVGFAPWSQCSYVSAIEDQELDIFLMFSVPSIDNRAAELLRQYTELTGRAPVPPLWSAGVILSKAYYQDAEEILAVAREVREKQMPCDVITFDGRAWQDTETRFAFEWCPKRYPNPDKVIKKLKALNFKICVWVYPLISVKHRWFREFADKGWLLKDKRSGQAYEFDWDQQAFGPVLTPLPKSGIVDFTHPDAYEFWRDAHKPLFDQGVDMIKADFGEQLDDDNMLAFNGESGNQLHNVYAHLYNRCVYEAASLYSKSGPFLFSRCAWIGSQRFNSHWGGDPQANWEGMMANIRGGLSWGLSGAPFYATDVGGFFKDNRDPTLYIRWAQNAVFSAHYRLHGIGPREPWSYGEKAQELVSSALALRYQLIPYLMKCYVQASTTGLPVQRPMVLAYPNERQAWAFENQFMFGDELLVVPCFDPDGWVDFYLPERPENENWMQFDPNSKYHASLPGGRCHRMQLALDEIAVFGSAKTNIKLGPRVTHTGALSHVNHK